MATRNEILEQALALSPEDRAFIADMLNGSLPDAWTREEHATYWAAEIDRRIAEYERDPSQGLDADESIAELRRSLAERRAQRSESRADDGK